MTALPKWGFFIVGLLLTGMTSMPVFAASSEYKNVAFDVQLVPGIGIGPMLARGDKLSHDYALHIIAGSSDRTRAIELATLWNWVREDVKEKRSSNRWFHIGPIQIAGALNGVGNTMNGTQLTLGANVVGSTANGIQIAGLGNMVRGSVNGIQLGGLANISGDEVNGIQLSGLANVTRRDVNGIQLSGLGNISGGEVSGIQLSGLANVANGSVSGVQFSGALSVVNGSTSGVIMTGGATLARRDISGVILSGVANVAGNSVEGLPFTGGFNIVRDNVEGLGVAGIANIAGGDVEGLLGAGVVNVARDDMEGLLVTSGFNVATKMEGLAVAGVGNVTRDDAEGLHTAGLFNYAHSDFDGLQIAGLLNYAKHLNGGQIGLVNYSLDADELLIGAVSYSQRFGLRYEAMIDEAQFATVNLHSGNKKWYNRLIVGSRLGNDQATLLGAGFGRRYRYEIIDWEFGASVSAVNLDSDFPLGNSDGMLYKSTLTGTIKVSDNIAVVLGPSLNFWLSKASDGSEFGGWPIWERKSYSQYRNVWVGGVFGIRFFQNGFE
ncbi:MAG: hypothetical protein OEM52_01535 [bacterium]|nr:hypothetical protein [bacterium]